MADQVAAAAQIDALVQLTFAVHEALDAGLSEEWTRRRSGGWLELTLEATILREVLAARIVFESEDEECDRRMAEQERLEAQIMRALERCGVTLAIQPEDIKTVPSDPSDLESEHHQHGKTPEAESDHQRHKDSTLPEAMDKTDRLQADARNEED